MQMSRFHTRRSLIVRGPRYPVQDPVPLTRQVRRARDRAIAKQIKAAMRKPQPKVRAA